MSAIFHQIFIFRQMIALQKLWKMFFISSKKLFSFLRYLNFCIFVFPSFFPCQPLVQRLNQENLKIYDVINCLTHQLWDIETLAIDRELYKEHFLWKNHAENLHQKLAPDLILILLNNPKQPLQARNSFKNKLF